MENRKEKEVMEAAEAKTLFIRFDIIEETKQMFLYIKKYYNLRANIEAFRLIVKKVYDEIKIIE